VNRPLDVPAELDEDLRGYLREYYGQRLQSNDDLTEKACCTTATASRFRDVLAKLPDEVVSRHYGCGCPVPEDDLRGLTCLDLGSGAGVDVFLLSSLVGPEGHVHGVDMTDEQLAVSREAAPIVAQRLGLEKPNTTFHKDFIETVDTIPSGSIDLVISDCVVNLSPRKDLVFQSIARVLKEGGELYISDIAANRRIPQVIADDPQLVAECLGGAMYEHDWFDLMKDCGFGDPRVVERQVLQTEAKGLPIVFSSLTVRAQKFTQPLDRRCEDYGQTATYLGTFPRCPARYVYDDHHVFERGRPTPVCRNTARMLSETRLGKAFAVSEPIEHFGLFDCGPSAGAAIPQVGQAGASLGACC
jgi:arsenite methyltransferase